MSNETVYVGELPTQEFVMRETAGNKMPVTLPETQKLSRLFNLFAALQILMILGGAVVGLFMAPLSIFVSKTEAEYIGWLVIGLIGIVNIALGVILIPLSIVAARGICQEKTWGKTIGIVAATLAIFEFPIGTLCGGFLAWKLFRRGNQ